MKVKHKARVLIVDDEVDLREVLKSVLVEYFTEVVTVSSYAEAVKKLADSKFDVIISDYKLGDRTGLEIRKWQIQNQADIQFILLTGYSEDPGIVTHLKTDYFKVLQKPAHINELILPLLKDYPKEEAA